MTTADTPAILITGCSSGIGRSIAMEALSRGLRVIATARRLEAIADLGAKGAKTLALDITAPQEDLARFGAEAIGIFGRIDILVNNAGYFQYGAMEEVSPEQLKAQFDTNFFGTINLTNVFLPHFRERRTGLIVNISSQVAYLAWPGAGVYGASKAALDSVSKVWAKELQPFNIRSVSINLGQFRTSVASSMKDQGKEIECYRQIHDFREQYRASSGKEPGDPEKAARKILDLVTSDEEMPARLAMGEEAVGFLDEDIRTQVQNMGKWRDFGRGTDVDFEQQSGSRI